MTQKQNLASSLGVLIVSLCLLGLVLFSRREPAYQGKSLSEWARQYGSNHWSGADRAADKEAQFAIQQIGTNAIPLLLDLMRVKDSGVNKKLRTVLPRRWHDKLGLRDRAGDVRRVGAHGVAALGTNASAAVPTLIDIATNYPEEDGRYIAVFALRTLESAAEPAIPFLIQCLTNKVDIIRDDAAIGLGAIGRQPEIVVPALLSYLEFAKTSPGTFEISDAIQSLSRFGPEAKAAVPAVLALLNDPRPEVREYATNCLLLIDAEAAAKAQVNRQY